MRDSLVLPFLFVAVFVAVLSVVCAFQILHGWGASYDPNAPAATGWVVRAVVPAFHRSILPAVVAALAVISLRTLRRPGIRILSVLLPAAAAFPVVLAALAAARSLCGDVGCPHIDESLPVSAGEFHALGNTLVYTETVLPVPGPDVAAELRSVVVVTLSERGPEFPAESRQLPPAVAWHGSATLVPATQADVLSRGTLAIAPSDGDAPRVSVYPERPIMGPSFDPPGLLARLFEEIEAMNRYVHALRAVDFPAYLGAVAALIVFSSGCGWLARVSRWPLFNAMAVLLALRFVPFLHAVLTSDIGTELSALIPDARLRSIAPSLALLTIGVLFLLLDVLFSPRRAGAGRRANA